MSDLFLVVNDNPVLSTVDTTEQTISLSGFVVDEESLRTWMASEFAIGSIPLRQAFSMLKIFGWKILMIFPTFDVPAGTAAMLKTRRDRILKMRSGK